MSRIRANQITNQAADGAPTVQHGLIIAGVSTFTGSVSIGGTLTYEDVTNIDSVGIITARDGLKVLGGGANVVGVVTATSFVGSGANLTGITQTTINNNADNRVITGSGSANTLNGEANLTFDGTKLNIATGGAGFRITRNSQYIELDGNFGNGGDQSLATSAGFRIQTGGVGNSYERLRITNTGLVGIGDNSPDRELVVKNASSNSTIKIEASNSHTSQLFFSDTDAENVARIGVFHGSGQSSSNAMIFETGGTARMAIKSDGKIGINETSPAAPLHVSKSYTAPTGGFDSNIVAALTNSGSNSYAGLAIQGGSGAGSFIHFGDTDDSNIGIINYEHSDNSMRFTVNASERFRIQSDGEVRIDGANDSQVLIHTDGGGWLSNSGNVVEVTGYFDYSGSRIGMYVNNSGEGVLGTKTTYGLNFYTNNTRRMRINGSGSVIFGNSTEGVTEPFFVETGGTIRRRYQTTNGSGIHFTGGSLMPTTGTGAFTNGGTNIGTGSYRWGQIYSTSSSISTSDRTLKNTIQSSDLGLEFIKKLYPVSYKFNDGTSGRTHYGLISQDVETVLTSLGKTGVDFGGFCKDKNTRVETKPDENGEMIDVQIEEEDDTYSLRYEEFIGPLVKAVQELSTEVETLKTKVATLEGS